MGEGGGEKRKEGFSPSALSLFSLPSCPFSPETPDTQARIELLEYLTGLNIISVVVSGFADSSLR